VCNRVSEVALNNTRPQRTATKNREQTQKTDTENIYQVCVLGERSLLRTKTEKVRGKRASSERAGAYSVALRRRPMRTSLIC